MRHLREVAVRSATGIYSVPARTYVCDDCLKGSPEHLRHFARREDFKRRKS